MSNAIRNGLSVDGVYYGVTNCGHDGNPLPLGKLIIEDSTSKAAQPGGAAAEPGLRQEDPGRLGEPRLLASRRKTSAIINLRPLRDILTFFVRSA